MTAKKHPQFILAATKLFFDAFKAKQESQSSIFEYNYTELLEDIQSHLIIGERHSLELNSDYRQILPYVIVRENDGSGVTKYVTYRRTSKVGEQRLAGNVSIGFGGHIDLSDIVYDNKSVISLSATIQSAAMREYAEELELIDSSVVETENTTEYYKGDFIIGELLILDDSNSVGKVHAGFIMIVDLPLNCKMTTVEEELESLPSMTAQELLSSDLPLENWTKIYLEHVTLLATA